MTSKKRLEGIRKQLEKRCLEICGHGSNENCICLNNQYANLEHLKEDLEILEIFKEQLHLNVYIGYFDGRPMYFLKIFEADIFITKEIYNKLKEWLNGKD